MRIKGEMIRLFMQAKSLIKGCFVNFNVQMLQYYLYLL